MKKSLIFKILYLILGIIVMAGASVFATNTYLANQVSYGNTSVETALNDLYTKYNGPSINGVISLVRTTGNENGAGKTLSWIADKDYSFIMTTWAGWSEKSHSEDTKGIVLYQTDSSASYKMILYKDVKKGDSFSITAYGGNGSCETLDISTFN